MSERCDSSPAEPLIRVSGINKRFGGDVALDDVDFELRAGEVHALLGENGAGKSTLIKILAGVVQRDSGGIVVGEQTLPNHLTPSIAREAGLSFVHQGLGLVEDLSIAENIALAVGFERRAGLISFRATECRVGQILEDLEIGLSPRRRVAELSQDEKVLVAVARAFSLNARVIVLDEISSSLPAPDVERLTQGLRAATMAGVGYVYVTHRIDEIFGFADRLTVLRDGKRTATADVERTDHAEVVGWILGERGAKSSGGRKPTAPTVSNGASALTVKAIRSEALHEPVSFELYRGEVLGLCGLVGAGAREVAAILGGARAASNGTAELEGSPLPLGDPRRLRALGCTYVPGDRQTDGGIFAMTVRENLFLTRVQRGSPDDRVIRQPTRERRAALGLVDRFEIRPRASVDRSLLTLSGGNQQKVVVGRAMRVKPRLIVVDDPTAGVDIGARDQIHEILRASAQEGAIVILASTDLEEIAALANRALVFAHGRVHADLRGEEITADELARASYAEQAPALAGVRS